MTRAFGLAPAFLAAATLMVSPLASAQDFNDEVIFESCLSELQLSEEECGCVVDDANAELSDIEHDFFVAHLLDDEEMVTELEAEMSDEEMNHVASFADHVADHCSY